jgi:hypothetical protein
MYKRVKWQQNIVVCFDRQRPTDVRVFPTEKDASLFHVGIVTYGTVHGTQFLWKYSRKRYSSMYVTIRFFEFEKKRNIPGYLRKLVPTRDLVCDFFDSKTNSRIHERTFRSILFGWCLLYFHAMPEYAKHPLRVGWRNFFSAVLEKFLQPINAPRVYGT